MKPVVLFLFYIVLGLYFSANVSAQTHATNPKQHAIVIGINQYKNADGYKLTNLDGAVNDAQLIYHALNTTGVNTHLLLNEKATKKRFLAAWQTMLNTASAGDTLILTFSGHGTQVNDQAPLDEKDGRDETLVFHEYQLGSSKGMLFDDELYGLFAQAQRYNILAIIDACHSAGIVRSIKRLQALGKTRSTRAVLDLKSINTTPQLALAPDSNTHLPHLTLVSAVDKENLVLHEVLIKSKPHGALSWFFADAIKGHADNNKNNKIDRNELSSFLYHKVRYLTKNRQTPKFLPQGDATAILTINNPVLTAPTLTSTPVKFLIDNVTVPKEELQHVHFVKHKPFDLHITRNRHDQLDVFNNTGDKVTSLANANTQTWQRLIDRQRLLNALQTHIAQSPHLSIVLQQGDKLHRYGDMLSFTIHSTNSTLNALTLFNLSGNGALQFIYPYASDPKTVTFPYSLQPAIQVDSPFGADNLIAIACQQPLAALNATLANIQPQLPNITILAHRLRNQTCQVAQYAFFTGE